jgi:hypothetical protein
MPPLLARQSRDLAVMAMSASLDAPLKLNRFLFPKYYFPHALVPHEIAIIAS